jgi:hypothetical protein
MSGGCLRRKREAVDGGKPGVKRAELTQQREDEAIDLLLEIGALAHPAYRYALARAARALRSRRCESANRQGSLASTRHGQ